MRKFVPRERKHKRRHQHVHLDDENANATEIQPISQDEKEERRKRLQEDLRAQRPESKQSAQKRKRLDKYIETKLKKEENLELLKKLAAQKVDTSLLQSAKKLGRVTENKRERLQRALKEHIAGVDVNGDHDAILFEKRPDINIEADDDDVESPEISPPDEPVEPASSTLDIGLKRPLDIDDEGRPIIKKRKRRGTAKLQFDAEDSTTNGVEISIDPQTEEILREDSEDGSDWNGFSDEDESQDQSSESEADEIRSSVSSMGDDGDDASKPARISAFKAWADSQRNETLGFTPSILPTDDATIRASFRPRKPSPDPEVNATTKAAAMAYRPGVSIVVTRSERIQSARLELPVVRDEQKIIEAIHNNPTVVVCGATGSGKTTQVPQMLFENGYASKGIIGVTQPRRVAATSVAARVAFEVGNDFADRVAHQVRYDSNVSHDTAIKFMTDGVLLRELSQDFVLSKYSIIVIDEAHERSVNTDILIGMLSRIVPLRHTLSQEQPGKYNPLKLVIMSATLRVTDFIMNDRLFKKTKPPIIQAEGRQYPVTDHFARRTQRDYVSEMIRKVSRGHRKLPPGGMLVFLTGQEEIQTVAKALRQSFAGDTTGFSHSRSLKTSLPQNDYLEQKEDHSDRSDSDVEIEGLDDSDGEESEFILNDESNLQEARSQAALNAHILPLYAALPSNQQMRVFQPPPDGSRLIVLATNVAETSLTIPGIRYVFDCGRSKEKCYDVSTGIQEFKVDWISQASAAQRKGRAGRTGPGHCYKMYSSAIYEQHFEEHTEPELLRTPIESTVLQLKNLEVDNVVNFPFPTPPSRDQLAKAQFLLKNLGAIDATIGRVTELGRELIHYPVNPRYGKMLILGQKNGVQSHALALVAALAVGDLFIPQPRTEVQITDEAASESDDAIDEHSEAKDWPNSTDFDQRTRLRQAHGRAVAKLSQWDDRSDAIKMLTAVASHASAGSQNQKTFCAQYFLREKAMFETEQLRRQLHHITQGHATGEDLEEFKTELSVPKPSQVALLRQIVAAGYIDHVAIRADMLCSTSTRRKPRRAIEVAYRTLLPSVSEIDRTVSPEEQEALKNVFVHPSSVLARLAVAEMPPYIIYSELSRPAASVVDGKHKRVRMHPLTTVGPKQLAALAEGTPLLQVGKPVGKIEDRDAGKKRECWVSIALRDPEAAGSVGWPLGSWKVLQARKGKHWFIEKVIARGGK